jgi:hypothetical protein
MRPIDAVALVGVFWGPAGAAAQSIAPSREAQ